MKNVNRASRNAGKKVRSAQSANAPKSLPGKAPVTDNISLIFISEKEGTSIAGVDLTAEEFETIKKDAAARNETLAHWLHRAVSDMLEAMERKGGAR